jgi:hypothetical protein
MAYVFCERGIEVQGGLKKIAKMDCSFRHVCLSVRVEQLASQWMDFHEI